jgi:hypothetical protein
LSWFRWYDGTRHNRKYRYLTPEGKVLFATLMELANETQGNVTWNGYIRFTETELYTDEQLADEARLPVEKIRPCLDAMKRVNFIEETEQGIRVLKWRERQYKTDSSTDRVRKYRDKKRDGNGDETLPKNSNEQGETVPVTPPEYRVQSADNISSSPTTRKRVLPDVDSYAYILSTLLRTLILQNNPNARVPPDTPAGLASWSSDVDKLFRIDNHTVAEVDRIIRWSQNDSFWRANILSGKTLRKQFDKLVLRAAERAPVSTPKPWERTFRHIQDAGFGGSDV